MSSAVSSTRIQIGEWSADPESGELTGPSGSLRLEPKVMQLLALLAHANGAVLSRDTLMEQLWPDVIVGDDSLARTVSKLRQALNDDARAPRYLQTLPKRGLRLRADPVDQKAPTIPAALPTMPLAPASASLPATPPEATTSPWPRHRRRIWIAAAACVMACLGWWAWSLLDHSHSLPSSDRQQRLARAEDAYFQFARPDNEAAIELYQRVLVQSPDDALAMAGLAKALTQRALRWPTEPERQPREFKRLADALANGHLRREPALSQLRRARLLAERATQLEPGIAATHRALGLVLATQGELAAAQQVYRQALALDPSAWSTQLSLGDVAQISGDHAASLQWLQRAYAAMDQNYLSQPAQVRPWQAALGILIAQRQLELGHTTDAESWYRQVLTRTPLHAGATSGLAQLLRAGGDATAAERLCQELEQRVGAAQDCR